MIIYIGVHRKILEDSRYEVELEDAKELVPTVAAALKALNV